VGIPPCYAPPGWVLTSRVGIPCVNLSGGYLSCCAPRVGISPVVHLGWVYLTVCTSGWVYLTVCTSRVGIPVVNAPLVGIPVVNAPLGGYPRVLHRWVIPVCVTPVGYPRVLHLWVIPVCYTCGLFSRSAHCGYSPVLHTVGYSVCSTPVGYSRLFHTRGLYPSTHRELFPFCTLLVIPILINNGAHTARCCSKPTSLPPVPS